MTAPAAEAPAEIRLCRCCAFRLDKVVEADGIHPWCAEAPELVEQWRKDGAAWNRRRDAARAREAERAAEAADEDVAE